MGTHPWARHCEANPADYRRCASSRARIALPCPASPSRKGWISSSCELHKTRKREFKYYRLTAAGRRQLAAEEQQWRRVSKAIASVMWPLAEE
jgi:hypothetical protein